jgi:uncharacterized membrane protein
LENSNTLKDKISIWPCVVVLISCLIFLHAAEQYLDDSPGPGVFYIMILPWVLLFILVVWVLFVVSAFRKKRKWIGVSRILGPPAAIIILVALMFYGIPPWRMWFELARPYYIFRVLLAPQQGQGKRVDFEQLDKELWQGHVSRSIVYNSQKSEGFKSSASCSGETFSQTTDLGFGFYAEEMFTTYGNSCLQK